MAFQGTSFDLPPCASVFVEVPNDPRKIQAQKDATQIFMAVKLSYMLLDEYQRDIKTHLKNMEVRFLVVKARLCAMLTWTDRNPSRSVPLEHPARD